MSFILQGSLEAQIDNDLKAISDGLRAWGIKMCRYMAQGYSLKRAAYIVDGSPLGVATRKRVNLWLIRRRNSDRALERRLKQLRSSRAKHFTGVNRIGE
jgi:hypothetical protein